MAMGLYPRTSHIRLIARICYGLRDLAVCLHRDVHGRERRWIFPLVVLLNAIRKLGLPFIRVQGRLGSWH